MSPHPLACKGERSITQACVQVLQPSKTRQLPKLSSAWIISLPLSPVFWMVFIPCTTQSTSCMALIMLHCWKKQNNLFALKNTYFQIAGGTAVQKNAAVRWHLTPSSLHLLSNSCNSAKPRIQWQNMLLPLSTGGKDVYSQYGRSKFKSASGSLV